MVMTYENLVSECKRLRLRAEKSEAEYMIFLMRAEREHEDVWKGGGCDTFEQFISSNHLLEPGRYRFFAIGVDRSSVDKALDHGAHWTIQLGRMPKPSVGDVKRFSERAAAFVELERVLPSEQAVRQWAAETSANGREPQQIRQVGELAHLRAENQELRAKLRAAEREIETLKKRLGSKAQQRPQPRA